MVDPPTRPSPGAESDHLRPAELALLAGPGPAAVPQPAHLSGCSRCAEVLADLVRLRRGLAELEPPKMPPAVATRLDAALARERAASVLVRPTPRRRSASSVLTAAAAAVLAVAGLSLTRGLEPAGSSGPGTTADLTGLGARPLSSTAATPPGGGSRGSAGSAPAVTESLVGQARALAAAVLGAPAREPTSPPTTSASRAALARCLVVLGASVPEVLAVGSTTLAGRPLTVVLLSDGTERAAEQALPTAGPAGYADDDAPVRTVSVRVVVPGCLHGARDIKFRLDGLHVR